MSVISKKLGIAISLLLAIASSEACAQALRIGITLHPYYSFVAHIVGDRAEIVPMIDGEANPHGYTPQPADIIRMASMDVLVVNGIGHDSWAFEILAPKDGGITTKPSEFTVGVGDPHVVLRKTEGLRGLSLSTPAISSRHLSTSTKRHTCVCSSSSLSLSFDV